MDHVLNLLESFDLRLQIVEQGRGVGGGLFFSLPPLPEESLNRDAIKKLSKCTEGIPPILQMIGPNYLQDSTSSGFDCTVYAPLATMLVAAYIEWRRPEWLDYKCYSVGREWQDGAIFHAGSPDESSQIQDAIERWIHVCMHDFGCFLKSDGKSRVFRRTLILCFRSVFVEHGEPENGGHCISLGLEASREEITLFVFDYRAEEYDTSAHNQMLRWMQEGVRASTTFKLLKKEGKAPCARTEIFCLKHVLHYGNDFMMCMSLAFRVCMYMSFVRRVHDMHENKEEFARDTVAYRSRLFRAINQLFSHKKVASKELTPTLSPAMVETPVYEVSSSTCYVMLVPKLDVKGPLINRIFVHILAKHAKSRLCFDLHGKEPLVEKACV